MQCEVKISKEVAEDLALREVAAAFFDSIESRPEKEIIIDFTGVSSISGSFAHEYWTKKQQSQKSIVEINMPVYVEKIFSSIKRREKTSRFEGLKNLEFVQL
jgi:2-hydroxy-3-keto-5-methylthiopentenyl-1-phosphate phosphatase